MELVFKWIGWISYWFEFEFHNRWLAELDIIFGEIQIVLVVVSQRKLKNMEIFRNYIILRDQN